MVNKKTDSERVNHEQQPHSQRADKPIEMLEGSGPILGASVSEIAEDVGVPEVFSRPRASHQTKDGPGWQQCSCAECDGRQYLPRKTNGRRLTAHRFKQYR